MYSPIIPFRSNCRVQRKSSQGLREGLRAVRGRADLVLANRCARAGALQSNPLFRSQLAHARPVPRRPRRCGQRRARPAERVLLRRRERRRLEDDRRRPRLDADVRLAAGRVDRRACRRAVGAGHRLRRQRRVDAARLDGLRQRHVQVHRRRQDVDAHRPRRHAAHRQDRRRSAGIRTSCSSRRSATCTTRIPTAASSARATAARPGRKCCSRTTTSARSTS